MNNEWRCARCGRLLGILSGERLHVKFSRGHEYLVSLPVTGVCKGCQSLNELKDVVSTKKGNTGEPSGAALSR